VTALLAPPRAVLFDWDNTLVDNWGIIGTALNDTLVAFGQQPWTEAEITARVTKSLRDSFPELFGTRWQEAMVHFYAAFEAKHLETLRALPGSAELLHALGTRGVYLGVVSNKTGSYLRREAAHLGWESLFGRLVGATDATEDKPSVAPVELALEGSGIARGPDVWFVGDSWIDLACAVNSGCTPVLVRARPPAAEEFEGHPPALHAMDCTALARRLDACWPR
jgi:phosphoglycolate phosphatase